MQEAPRNDAEAIKGAIEGVISDIASIYSKGRQRGADLLSEGLGEARSAHQRIRLQRVTILRNVLRDLKPTLIVDAPAGQGRSSFDHAAI